MTKFSLLSSSTIIVYLSCVWPLKKFGYDYEYEDVCSPYFRYVWLNKKSARLIDWLLLIVHLKLAESGTYSPQPFIAYFYSLSPLAIILHGDDGKQISNNFKTKTLLSVNINATAVFSISNHYYHCYHLKYIDVDNVLSF